ncbi:Predicted transcriptional regulator, contains HTH domain [Halogranum rubrum]|uniref:Predicted transcriptional regulator, contains HTH domain n=1 Tax=Halogranum rubrum TaxID=553466 RepID=A0A1I4I9Q0_9EURY|nr:GntR family transcriptional regulator [Halogranum rubrum]SFL50491.1 Predicted transcriptional regulator, contains HTH domain [Halogranum rubrum]
MARPDPTEVMAVVARRGTVLRAVDTEGVPKRDLVEALSVSRSTIDRAVRELEAIGFIERQDDGRYCRTLPGELALSEYDQFASRMDGLVTGVDIVSLLPADTPFDTCVLEDATIVAAERHSPLVPVESLSDLVNRANEVDAIAPAVLPQQVEVYHAKLVEGTLDARLVVTDVVVERLVSAYGVELRESLATGRLSVRQTGRSIPYSLVVAETDEGTEMGLLIYADSGVQGFIGNDTPGAVEWARGVFDKYWNASTPLPEA